MVISQEDFYKLKSLVYDYCGINFEDNKKYFLEKRVLAGMKNAGLKTPGEYYDLLSKNPRGEELKNFTEELTTNETYFFREMRQLGSFVEAIYPAILEEKKKALGGCVNIWSAGSSSGEEPYTLAILLNESPAKGNFRITATDLNRKVLELAKKGIYGRRSLKDIPPNLIRKYFQENKDEFALKEEIRRHVHFQMLNLIDDIGMCRIKYQDAIFCRNVLIYFDDAHRRKIVDSFYRSLNPGGYLFLGHSESLGRDLQNFKQIKINNILIYQK